MTAAAIAPKEDERLRALAAYDVLDSAAEEHFDQLTRLAAEICGTPISLISLVDADRQWFKSKLGLTVSQTPRDVAFCAHAILGEGLFEVADASDDPRFQDNPLVAGHPDIRFYAGAPLRTPAGHNVGTLCVIDRLPRELTPDQRQALSVLGAQVVAQLELRRTLRDLAHATRTAVALEDLLRRYTSHDAWVRAEDSAGAGLQSIPAREVELAYVFIDTVGFTTLSEQLAPHEVSALLNRYFGPMVEAILASGGSVEKFIGDCIFATFRTVEDTIVGLREVQRCIGRVNAEQALAGQPALQFSIGANCGRAIRTDLGSARRSEHTLIGDAVNIASRVQGRCPPGEVMVTDCLLGRMGDQARVLRSELVPLRGRSEPIQVSSVDLG